MEYVQFREINGAGVCYDSDTYKTPDIKLIEKEHKKRNDYHKHMPGNGFSEKIMLTSDHERNVYFLSLIRKDIVNVFPIKKEKLNVREFDFGSGNETPMQVVKRIRAFQNRVLKGFNSFIYNDALSICVRLITEIKIDETISPPRNIHLIKDKTKRYRIVAIGDMKAGITIPLTDEQQTLIASFTYIEQKIQERDQFNLLI